MKDFIFLDKCCLCDCDNLLKVIGLSPTPPANELPIKPMEQEYFPLDVMQCQDCGHHQLSGEVNPERVFINYVYVAGTNCTNRTHFKDYASILIDRFNLNKSSRIFEIGSNDGTMLSAFQSYGIKKVLGIDPAKHISAEANRDGVPTINGFFSLNKARELINDGNITTETNIIIANNVLAHTSQLQDIVEGIKLILKDDGELIFEVSYFLDVLNKTLFDLIYNEHIHQHLLGPLVKFFKKNDMHLYDVERIPNHGGSIRVYVSKKQKKLSDSLLKCLKEEQNITNKIELFNNNIAIAKNNLLKKLTDIKSQNKTIAAYGLPAKACTLMHQFNIGKEYIDFIVDDNPLKQGLFSVGHNIPIVHPDEIYNRKPDYVLILAWNFATSIITSHTKFLIHGKAFIVPFPNYYETNSLRGNNE